eukprot:scaffold895_cov315-Pinguiococcus_pyrenoidosus.AAC.42
MNSDLSPTLSAMENLERKRKVEKPRSFRPPSPVLFCAATASRVLHKSVRRCLRLIGSLSLASAGFPVKTLRLF